VAYLDVHADQEDSAESFRRSNKRRAASLTTCKSKLVRFFFYTDTDNTIVPCLVKSNDKPNKQAVIGVEGLAKLYIASTPSYHSWNRGREGTL
jgi:hypothetical protein